MELPDFNLRALYEALDEQRRVRSLSWKAVADEVSRHCTHRRPIAASTITSLKQKPDGEGDGILQMLLWLRRTPESFVPGASDPQSERFCQPQLTTGQILRWDTRALFAALDVRRRSQSLTCGRGRAASWRIHAQHADEPRAGRPHRVSAGDAPGAMARPARGDVHAHRRMVARGAPSALSRSTVPPTPPSAPPLLNDLWRILKCVNIYGLCC